MSQWQVNNPKIDDLAVDGLLGVSNSLAYKVHEIENHMHSRGVWFGLHTAISAGVNEGEAWSVLPFVSTSGADGVFGAWIPILGTSDTPYKATYAKFDPHRMIVANVSVGASLRPHIYQFAWSATTGADGFTAGDFTGEMTLPERAGKADSVEVHAPRVTAGLRLFFRHLVIGAAGGTMDFYIGTHEYAG